MWFDLRKCMFCWGRRYLSRNKLEHWIRRNYPAFSLSSFKKRVQTHTHSEITHDLVNICSVLIVCSQNSTIPLDILIKSTRPQFHQKKSCKKFKNSVDTKKTSFYQNFLKLQKNLIFCETRFLYEFFVILYRINFKKKIKQKSEFVHMHFFGEIGASISRC